MGDKFTGADRRKRHPLNIIQSMRWNHKHKCSEVNCPIFYLLEDLTDSIHALQGDPEFKESGVERKVWE